MYANKLVKISPTDVVAVAVIPLAKDTTCTVDGQDITLLSDIPAGHKVALVDIPKGGKVIKYGYPIGGAKEDIPAGSHIHTHNVRTLLSESAQYTYDESSAEAYISAQQAVKEKWEKKFSTIKAYRRADGRIGVRNELWIIPTVGCVNRISEKLVEWARQAFKDIPAVENIQVWGHPYGCSQLGTDHENTRVILADLARHPNAGGVLVFGLGCENNTMKEFKELLGPMDPERTRYLVAQDVPDELEAGKQLLCEIAKAMKDDKRVDVPVSELVLGMKCGGSDGFSGITANPLVGRMSDILTSLGGTVILTEVPEMFGAEQVLMDRCVNRDTFIKTTKLIDDFKDYFVRHGQVVYENPSPGNKDGGITTLEDKSLGCVQKGGLAPVRNILGYGERVSAKGEDKELTKGLTLLSGPGNDIVSTTALTAAGAHMILFTTGRGTPLGAPVPTVKIATNDRISEMKKGWIDFNAGRILHEDVEKVTEDFVRLIADTASGRKTKNEDNGYAEISLFKDGVIL
ncbi:UxaA family hydrolase [Parasphaerochaeta coccoides]|uniref:D-altronate dehydratase n=1 Tax=Parasphaerochaeta coccoides (strain ATCC BAA-1237 / DSM 17374 / SPN1) TaxID=760011 RepID=F4GIZ4_PARC1|nr:altronate dehydratase family protein [Parasphaerochaeta coccoides]AEC01289.1 D-altronate dehydratase [Parasphaerochaeta coccoides DSM 17374]